MGVSLLKTSIRVWMFASFQNSYVETLIPKIMHKEMKNVGGHLVMRVWPSRMELVFCKRGPAMLPITFHHVWTHKVWEVCNLQFRTWSFWHSDFGFLVPGTVRNKLLLKCYPVCPWDFINTTQIDWNNSAGNYILLEQGFWNNKGYSEVWR